MITIGVLVAAPLVAAADLAGAYWPFGLLRLWMIGFSIYGYRLSERAGGVRKALRWPFAFTGLIFAFVWGLEVEQWAVIDFSVAVLVAAGALALRTEPAAPGVPVS